METEGYSLLPAAGLLVGGLIMLVLGGESLIGGATRLARRLGMPPLLIGLTIVAFGTSLPELFVSVTAAVKGFPDIMIGNVVGSNIANVGLILGFCSLLAPLSLPMREVRIELLLVTAGSTGLMLCAGYGTFPRPVALIFVLVLISYTALSVVSQQNNSRDARAANREERSRIPFVLPLLMVGTGLFFLATGSDIFIRGAVSLARYFGISELVIGLTLAAIGTSLPELASSVAALRHGESGLLIGNVIGSNMFNLFMVLGLTGLIKPFPLSAGLLQRDLPVMLAFTVILFPILHRWAGTNRWHGLLLLGGYLAYCLSLA